MLNKKLMTKQQKMKTKSIFTQKMPKIIQNKNILVKSSKNFNKTNNKKEKNENKADKTDKGKENQVKVNQIIDQNKKLNINKSNKLYEIKYESTLFSPIYINKNQTERKMPSNLSDDNMKQFEENLSSNRKKRQKFRTKNYISKSNNLMHLNNSAKLTRAPHKNYKSFLIKNKIKLNKDFNNHSSEKNLLSINILHRIREVKQNKNKKDFYTTLKAKNSGKSYNTNNSINNVKSIKIIKTPVLKYRKTNIFKNRINKKIKNENGNKTKDELNHNYMSSFSIKVNKTNNNKEKEKIYKNNNLKKTWTKNIKKNC